ncbi:uncharacterized protein F5147DRAFT_781798 [Suillus discolor]|uniref:Uncharacterized protein n=1 Tax=Suillus discolor TaxID=1912936 RepID=A0A9P7ES41_9AGAM|nr:uncharacterized protein F5147DRAFT_781798 [Suillus discolor]KAG2086014.1 hypothetical protein F5147DRAFT_781798 [Suillus discolor]
MSRLMTFVSSHPDDDNPDPSVESYSLHELRPVHTYPPQPITTSVHAYPPKPAALPNEDFAMSLYNPWETVRRPRDGDIDRPTKVLLKEVDQSARLRDNVHELQYSKHELLLRKRYAQRNANSQESEMQSVIDQYRQKLESLELKKVEAITSLEQQHHNKIVTLQSQIRQAQVAVSVSPPAWHLTGKKPIATCTNIIRYSPILDEDSDSPVDEEPQIAGSEYFTDVQRRDNKANVCELFKVMFHLTKDEDYMLYSGASREAVTSFIDGTGHGPDPLMLQWDITATHKSDWNQRATDILLSIYISMEEKNHWVLTCRATKFETRQKVTSTLLSDRKVTGKDDLPVWVYLNSIVETLGKDGMSSDESDVDDCEVQALRLKSMPWRADFSHEMKIVDAQRFAGAAIFTPRGSKPAKCLHNPKRESLQPAVAALPRAFYNPLWLSKQRSTFKVSNTKFQRMEIMVAHK